MAIDNSGQWWIGTEAADIQEYLEAYSSEGYPVQEFRLSKCQCGSPAFRLNCDEDECVANRICIQCSEAHYIGDSDEYWAEADPEAWECVECGADRANIGLGFALRENQEIKWVYIGTRCDSCGLLACPVEFKVNYEPSRHLLNSA